MFLRCVNPSLFLIMLFSGLSHVGTAQPLEVGIGEMKAALRAFQERLAPIQEGYEATVLTYIHGVVDDPDTGAALASDRVMEGRILAAAGNVRSSLVSDWRRSDNRQATWPNRTLINREEVLVSNQEHLTESYLRDTVAFESSMRAQMNRGYENIFTYAERFGIPDHGYQEYLDYYTGEPHRVTREVTDEGYDAYKLYASGNPEDLPSIALTFDREGLLRETAFFLTGWQTPLVRNELDYGNLDGDWYPSMVVHHRYDNSGSKGSERTVVVQEMSRRRDIPDETFTRASFLEELEPQSGLTGLREYRDGQDVSLFYYWEGEFIREEDFPAIVGTTAAGTQVGGGRLQDFLLANRVVLSILLLLPLLYLAGRTLVWPAGKRT